MRRRLTASRQQAWAGLRRQPRARQPAATGGTVSLTERLILPRTAAREWRPSRPSRRRWLLSRPAGRAPQLWNVEAVDATGHVLAAWRGVQLRDSGPLPRNAAWPPTLLSVFLERSAVDLGLDEGLRVTVSCGQPDWPLPQLLSTVPLQSLASDAKAPMEGRHAGPERRALNTVKAPGVGALAGFGLMVRAPVPVACGWVTVQPGHRQHEPAPGMASAFAQLRAELAEPPAVSGRQAQCDRRLPPDGAPAGRQLRLPAPAQLSVARTTGDGWALLGLGRAVIACAVVELSGVSAPVAVAPADQADTLTRAASGAAVPRRLTMSWRLRTPALAMAHAYAGLSHLG